MTGVAGAAAERSSRGVNADRAMRIEDHAARAIDAAHLLGACGLIDPEGVEIGAYARERGRRNRE